MSKWVKNGAGHYSACSKILFDDSTSFWWDEADNYFTREAEIIDIVFALDKNSFRIFTLERDIYQIGMFKCKTIIFYVLLGLIYIF